MPDVYATIAEIDVATQEHVAGILELRAADPQQRAMLNSYLSEISSQNGRGSSKSAAVPGRSSACWPATLAWQGRSGSIRLRCSLPKPAN
jgi:hypothetical protein